MQINKADERWTRLIGGFTYRKFQPFKHFAENLLYSKSTFHLFTRPHWRPYRKTNKIRTRACSSQWLILSGQFHKPFWWVYLFSNNCVHQKCKSCRKLQGSWTDTKYWCMTFEAMMRPWTEVSDSLPLHILSLLWTPFSKLFENLLKGWRVSELTNKYWYVTFEHIMRPRPWAKVNKSRVLHTLLALWTFAQGHWRPLNGLEGN